LVPAESTATPVFLTDGHSLQNRFYKIDVEDDGTLRIRDKELDIELPRCNWFVDEGDRGDEYNFDALLDPQKVTASNRRVDVEVDAKNPVAGRLRLHLEYDLPRRLEGDRETRSGELVTVPITTEVTLYADVKRIDFVTTVDNKADDHRLRVHFQTPVRSETGFFEQAFSRDRAQAGRGRGGDGTDAGALGRLAVARRSTPAQGTRRTGLGDAGRAEFGCTPFRVRPDHVRRRLVIG
jgi:hypothetical protein